MPGLADNDLCVPCTHRHRRERGDPGESLLLAHKGSDCSTLRTCPTAASRRKYLTQIRRRCPQNTQMAACRWHRPCQRAVELSIGADAPKNPGPICVKSLTLPCRIGACRAITVSPVLGRAIGRCRRDLVSVIVLRAAPERVMASAADLPWRIWANEMSVPGRNGRRVRHAAPGQ
jgi:hypothetical protein